MKRPIDKEMKITDNRGEHTPMTDAEWKAARKVNAHEILPKGFIEASRAKRGRPKTDNPKVPISLRVSPELAAHLKDEVPEYTLRIEALLNQAWKDGRI